MSGEEAREKKENEARQSNSLSLHVFPAPAFRDEVETSVADLLPERFISIGNSRSSDEERRGVCEEREEREVSSVAAFFRTHDTDQLTIQVGQIELDGDVVEPRSEPFRVPLGVDGDLWRKKMNESLETR